jgi:hypothetical protein
MAQYLMLKQACLLPGHSYFLDQNGQPIGDNVAFEIDPQTGDKISIPATQVTNNAGEFIYPLVKAGTYSFIVDTKLFLVTHAILSKVIHLYIQVFQQIKRLI